MLGSSYGSTSPKSIDPQTGQPYRLNFPLVTTRDNARFFGLVADYLGIRRIRLLMGGSMGGQQAAEWACLQPKRFDLLCLLATNARHSPYGIALNESQRHYRTYLATQQQSNPEDFDDFRASSYQRYQGYKLWKRFDPCCYYALTRSMDSHHLGRGRRSNEEAFDTDVLFPTEEQSLLSRYIPNSRLDVMSSDYGHDGFLVETPTIGRLLADFLADQLQIDSGTKHAFTDGLSGRTFAIPGTEEV